MDNWCRRCGKRRAKEDGVCGWCLPRVRAEEQARAQADATVCTQCKRRVAEGGYKQCERCRAAHARAQDKWRKGQPDNNAGYLRERNARRRHMVLDYYGGRCICCGETTWQFLALDHHEGGGDAHRREVGSGSRMVDWIIKNGYPPEFQVLCHNCNQAIGYYGECPHGTLPPRPPSRSRVEEMT